MLFKCAISISSGEKPFSVHLAIPKGDGTFVTHEYKMKDRTSATILMMDYMDEYIRGPGKILDYHYDIRGRREAMMELPFHDF